MVPPRRLGGGFQNGTSYTGRVGGRMEGGRSTALEGGIAERVAAGNLAVTAWGCAVGVAEYREQMPGTNVGRRYQAPAHAEQNELGPNADVGWASADGSTDGRVTRGAGAAVSAQ